MDGRITEFAPDILVVDSDAATRLWTLSVLRFAGYRVTAIASFAEAKDHMRSACPSLLITDIRLGEFNGLHLAWHRYFDHPGLPTIITDSRFDRVLEAESKEVEALYLVKPIQSGQLLDAVAKLLDRGFYLDFGRSLSTQRDALSN
jgi:two-component system C4-dicarboxylate transport response regulator DctD